MKRLFHRRLADHLKQAVTGVRRFSKRSRLVQRCAPPITAIVLTRGDRDQWLAGCLASIAAQQYSGKIRILLVVDADSCTDLNIPILPGIRMDVWSIPNTVVSAGLAVRRVAQLRNLAKSTVHDPLITYMDDDNEWLPDHLSTLVTQLQKNYLAAAHSWRVLIDDYGQPVVPTSFPWETDKTIGDKRFTAAVEAGIFEPGSPIVRDRVRAWSGGRDIGMVDLGEWLFSRELLDAIQFSTDYDANDIMRSVGEDDKLLAILKELNVPVGSSEQPTLRYRLGGFSNRASADVV